MLVYFGSRERTVNDWTYLLGKADERFKLNDAHAASGQANVIISVVWDATSEGEVQNHTSSRDVDPVGRTPDGQDAFNGFK